MKDQITANLVLVIIKQLNSVNHHSVMYAVMHLFHPNLPIFLNVKFNVKKSIKFYSYFLSTALTESKHPWE